MTATAAIVALLRKQIADRVECLEMNRADHINLKHQKGCHCGEQVAREERAIAEDLALLARAEAELAQG